MQLYGDGHLRVSIAGAKLYVTCPANKTVQSSNGSAVAVTYSATTEGGVAPVTVSGTPASGSLFPVGTTTVHVNARSSDGQSSWCSFTVTVTTSASAAPPPPPPSTSAVGPSRRSRVRPAPSTSGPA